MKKENVTTATKTIGSVQKAVHILKILASATDGKTLTEISQEMDCGVSAVYHLINTLKLNGIVDQNEINKKYRLGAGLYSLCSTPYTQSSIAAIAQPYLDRLNQRVSEACNLIILEGLHIIYIAQSSARNMPQMFTQIGSKVPYYCTGSGKAILAFKPTEIWKRYFNNTDFIQYTPNTIKDIDSLRAELTQIREYGLAYDREEYAIGITCVAAPIFSKNNEIIAAISVSGPTRRIFDKIKDQALEENIRTIASELSEDLKVSLSEREL